MAHRSSHEARLGYIIFRYRDDGSGGTIQAFDGGNGKLMWSLKAPLDADSSIRCYDNETLLIKSADGFARLVTAEDGQVTKTWEPGVEAPPATASHAVNPFGVSVGRQDASARDRGDSASPIAARVPSRDQEKRLERVEQSIRALTEAVDRLERAGKEQQNPSTPK